MKQKKDIVDRLRGIGCKTAGCELMRFEAADEIKRLRTALDAQAKLKLMYWQAWQRCEGNPRLVGQERGTKDYPA